ncbi:hypothetical protein NC796_19755 [Aliifodinibius sp. S!AR15-10]|nr:hypothetical protein [Aliifodinibius sp. S!AR15-10]MDR8393400.1 hypothetical protein [Aliifodinibius sp. S!AR15-10]
MAWIRDLLTLTPAAALRVTFVCSFPWEDLSSESLRDRDDWLWIEA